MEENNLKGFWELIRCEIRVIDVNCSKILMIGFFEDSEELIKAVREYDGVANMYIGQNPRNLRKEMMS